MGGAVGAGRSQFRVRDRKKLCSFAAPIFAAAALFTLASPRSAEAQLMTLPDSISVSETGGAIQSFTIAVPPGTAGVAPSLSLTYNSQGQNGIVGMGFMLNGLASIGRCAKTKATDGVIDGVGFDAEDRFCLDGQRLIAISGAYGANETEYRTEIESFSKVVSYGSAGSGPSWFKVWTKSGQVMEFGNTQDSRILATGKPEARSWAVNKVSDTAGNFYTVTYVNDAANGQAYPSRIDYTGNAGAALAPYNSVRFVYNTTRSDVVTVYQAGSFTRTTVLLTNVQTYAGSTLVSDYRLTYNTGAGTSRLRLRTITLCEGGGACLPATTIGWTSGGDGTPDFDGSTNPITPSEIDDGTGFHFGDWNGDGLTDVMWWDTGPQINRWYINNGAVNGAISFTKYENPIVPSQLDLLDALYFGDWNGDGITDVMGRNNTDGHNRWFINGGSLNFTEISNPITPSEIDDGTGFHFGDWNGDGLTDVMWWDTGPQTNLWYINNGAVNGTISFTKHENPIPPSQLDVLDVLYFGDWNGDGLTDVMGWETQQNNVNSWFINNGNPGFTLNATGIPLPGSGLLYFDDWNGDGITDFTRYLASNGENNWFINNISPPDILSTVTNGLGAQTSITYRPMTDGSVYTKDTGAQAASYPIVDLQGPMQIASQVERSDGVGGMKISTYRYKGAKLDLTGRGFLGFREMTERDGQTGIEQTSVYEQDYPKTLMKKSQTRSFNGVVLGNTVNSYGTEDLGGTRRRVFLTQSVTSGADLNGSPLPSTTTAYQYDAFSNATQIGVTASDGFSKTTTNTYLNDTSNWLLGRLLTANVASNAPAAAAQPPAGDATPNAFDFTDVIEGLPGTIYEDSADMTGFNRPVTASVSGGGAEIRKNGTGSWGSSASINPGDTLNLRMTSSASYGATVTATVTVGGVSADWIVSNVRAVIISSNVNSFNLRIAHDALYPAPTGSESPPISVVALVEPGVIVGSASTTVPAFNVGDWPAGTPISIEVKGRIQGAGGRGGDASSSKSEKNPGEDGGTALYTRYAIKLDMTSGEIWGGGGGGAGGRIKDNGKRAGSGGGGAGQLPGQPGAEGNGNNPLHIGQPGTTEAGGAGGQNTTGEAQSGRAGGDPGLPGGSSGGGSFGSTVPGGNAGVAIWGSYFVTQTGTGDIRGPVKDGLSPDPFTFPSLSNANRSTLYSASAVLSDFIGPLTATAGGGAEVRKNGAGTWASTVSVSGGDTIEIRRTSSSSYSSTVSGSVTVGAITANFSITTEDDPTIGDPGGGGG
jgi:hypothetical protein